ncbi:hypothetical protein [Pseudorhodobacter sp.]|uniref:hypothetical protein n=1 Tax=Pseudorhodobacter sp. TaxID=1934400 RepID=UPI002B001310|nr:hypothetical protein [Pseudorhodobacter sp.]
MTEQMPVVANGATLICLASAAIAPPFAPLVMPKQILQAKQGLIGRGFGVLLVRLALLKHGFRRVD